MQVLQVKRIIPRDYFLLSVTKISINNFIILKYNKFIIFFNIIEEYY